uniref:Uncharacterized protein n=1 Tax=Oryza brachyantha TaxID=4533 RepID=J3L7M1_ORYBR
MCILLIRGLIEIYGNDLENLGLSATVDFVLLLGLKKPWELETGVSITKSEISLCHQI